MADLNPPYLYELGSRQAFEDALRGGIATTHDLLLLYDFARRLESALAEAEAKVEGYASELHSVGIRAEQAESALADQKAHGSRLADEITSLRNALAEANGRLKEIEKLGDTIALTPTGSRLVAQTLAAIRQVARQHPEASGPPLGDPEIVEQIKEWEASGADHIADAGKMVEGQPEASGPVEYYDTSILRLINSHGFNQHSFVEDDAGFRMVFSRKTLPDREPIEDEASGLVGGPHAYEKPERGEFCAVCGRLPRHHDHITDHDIDEVFGHAKELREEQRSRLTDHDPKQEEQP